MFQHRNSDRINVCMYYVYILCYATYVNYVQHVQNSSTKIRLFDMNNYLDLIELGSANFQ